MDEYLIFHQITEKFELGAMLTPPQKITGGYMHKMYRLETTEGEWAIKLLNPEVMKRPDALSNFQRAERFERMLQINEIPIVPAIEVNGQKMHLVDGQYVYAFRWFPGKALGWNEINAQHCKAVGELLARIHVIERRQRAFTVTLLRTDWAGYIGGMEGADQELAEKLRECLPLLYTAQDEYNAALEALPDVTCVCNSDMDSKNVLWLDDCPTIIDLECLDYGNPYYDMFKLALEWSGQVTCSMDYRRLHSFITAYQAQYGSERLELRSLYGIGFAWLDWLEYNVQCAVGMEYMSREDRGVSISQARSTLQRIEYYSRIKNELLEQLGGL